MVPRLGERLGVVLRTRTNGKILEPRIAEIRTEQSRAEQSIRLSTPKTKTAAKMPSTYEKPKPWDTDDIDKWKVSYIYFSSCFSGVG